MRRTAHALARSLLGVEELPDWEPAAAGVLCVAGPHPIPVSTAVRAGGRRLLVALGSRRETLARLRADPAAAYCLLAEGLAFTAHGRAAVVSESLECAPRVAAVELAVDRLQDHLADGRTEMLSGPAWRWRDEGAAAVDPRIRAELEALAAAGG